MSRIRTCFIRGREYPSLNSAPDHLIVALFQSFRASGFGFLSDFGLRISDLITASPCKYGVSPGAHAGPGFRFVAPWRADRLRVRSNMVVLKSKLSGFYFKTFGSWSANAADAMSFPDEWVARDFVLREHVDDVQVIDADEGGGNRYSMSIDGLKAA
jgi:hypothetical protein